MNEMDLKSIFTEYRDKVFGFFVSSLGDRDLAADLTQALFYKLCKKQDSLHEIRNINAYIFWMAQNMVIDHLRRAAHETEYRPRLINACTSTSSPAFYHKTELEYLIDDEHYDELFNQILHDLTPQQHLTTALSKKEGLSNNRIAGNLGRSPNTVQIHLHQ